MSKRSGEAIPMSKNPLFSWEVILIKLLLLALVGVVLQKPAGVIVGRLALQQEGFNLYNYNVKQHNVYAVAIGPRGSQSEERGVWVKPDGSFRIDSLPVGEYTLKVRVPGFATKYDSGIFVEEGKVSGLDHDILLEMSDPSVNLATNSRVFTTKETPRFWMNANGGTRAEVRVFKQDMLSLVKTGKTMDKFGFEVSTDMSIYKPYGEHKKTAIEHFKSTKPVQRWIRALKGDEEDWSHEEFKFEQPLPPGDYIATAEIFNIKNKSDWAVIWFSVTDVGLIVKQDKEKTVTRAIDLNTLKPLSGVNVQLLNRSQTPYNTLGSGTTGSDGFVQVKHPKTLQENSSSQILVYGNLGDQRAYGGIDLYSNTSDTYKTFFYTDRPVYRLGQTVYWKGISRHRDGDKMVNPGAGVTLDAVIEDPDANKVWEGKITTSKHGTFHGLFEIPKEGKTGAYQVHLTYPDGADSYERFEVAEYRKPEYLVEVIPALPRVTAGQKAKARIRANYYFGAPVANAKVKYTIYRNTDWDAYYNLMSRPEYMDYFNGWDSDGYESSYNGDYVSEATATTDEHGEVVVEFDTQKIGADQNESEYSYSSGAYPQKYKVEAEVTDISRLSVLGSGSVSVTPGDYALYLSPDTYVAEVGQKISATTTAVSYDNGHPPIKNLNVKMKLWRRKYDRNRHEYKGEEVYEEKMVTTDDKGIAKATFDTKPDLPTDTYYVTAAGADSANNKIWDTTSIWIVSQNYPYSVSSGESQKEPLTIKLDKDAYQPGDTAKVMITAPVTGTEGAQAIVAIEGGKLHSYQVVDMKATANLVKVPITLDYAPNVYVTVTFVGKKHQYYNQSEMIKVSPAGRFLNLVVSSDKPKYKPGENATYTVKATYSDGKPAPNTELSLGIVDESIYAIRPDSTPDIRKFFYAKRENQVNTICSFPEEYSGGPNKIEPRVRKDFRDTAAWIPSLVTNAEGIATTTIKLPDNLTTWRATARAITMNTEVGWTLQKVVSTQDLILRLALPRFFSQGDEGMVTAVVHNYSDTPQAVNLTLSLSEQFQIKDSLVQKVLIQPEKVARYSWPVTILSAGEGLVRCKAVGTTAGDAMETKLPIRPLGVPAFIARNGMIDAEDATVDIGAQLPPDVAPGSVKYNVYLSASSIGPLMGTFSSLIDYPYGCTEQTMSRLMPSVVAIRMNQVLGAPLSKKDQDKFREVYKQSMQKLDSHQHSDGGWGWWTDDDSNPYLTSLVLEGYDLLKQSGFYIDPSRQSRAVKWLKQHNDKLLKELTDPLHRKDSWTDAEAVVDMARAAKTLAQHKQPVSAAMEKYALQQKNRLGPQALCYFTSAFQKSGKSEVARSFYDRLMEVSNNVSSDMGATLDWSETDAMAKKYGGDKEYWRLFDSYRCTDVERTALALETVTATEPDNADRIEQIKRWILTQRGKDGWSNTKTTAQVYRAFMAAELLNTHRADTDFVADIQLPGQVSNLTFGPKSVVEAEKTLRVKNAAGGTCTVHKKGAGKLYYTTLITFYRSIKPGGFVAAKAIPEQLKLRREFYRLKPSAPDANGNVRFSQELISDRKVKAGETILMKVYVDSPIYAPYILMEVPLPSGAEVVKEDSRSRGSGSDEEDGHYYNFGSWWWTHQDVLDDRVAFFVDSFPADKREFHTMLRMELPGKFQLNPLTFEGMYTNRVRAYSQADTITVTE